MWTLNSWVRSEAPVLVALRAVFSTLGEAKADVADCWRPRRIVVRDHSLNEMLVSHHEGRFIGNGQTAEIA